MSSVSLYVSPDVIQRSLLASFAHGERVADPYPHWLIADLFPAEVMDALLDLPFKAPDMRVSGTREINNETRRYFDADARGRYPVVGAIAEAFQRRETVTAIEQAFGASLAGTFLRIEYAQDTDGFWLTPHTDIGPKKVTMLAYVSRDQPVEMGTDVYRSKEEHFGAVPFRSNTALVFVPSDRTWHGFERRPIVGVRTSIIINYVTGDWRAKEQLAYRDTPVY